MARIYHASFIILIQSNIASTNTTIMKFAFALLSRRHGGGCHALGFQSKPRRSVPTAERPSAM